MPEELWILGSLGIIVSLGAFGGAVYETIRLHRIMIISLGGDKNGDKLD